MENARRKILLVDDDVQALETMRTYVEEVAEVATVTGGRQAIEYVQVHPVDMIFLDVNMPLMDGFKTLEQFRNLKECIKTAVVLVTGQRDKYTVMNAIAMGVDGYLVKPVSREALLEKIEELQQKMVEKENRKTILAIDDDMVYLKMLDSYLRDTYNVIIINQPKLALDYLMKHTPDLILLDYQMPLYSGASLLSMIQKKEENASIPVIILSGAIDKDVLMDCYVSNPVKYLAKPVSKEVLLANISLILNQ